ncbi:MAG: hypothetical protein KKI08_27320 [Armatimonadetes bacterium]|nr:hypothetical protein [Armatimonadota bacterium]
MHALPELISAAYSRRPEHAEARAQVVALNHQSLALAHSLAAALPDELQEFWEAYAGWFAMYSVAPLLVNMTVARQAIAGLPLDRAAIHENWRRRGWWSGREDLLAAMGEPLSAAGWRVEAHPGAALRALRRALAPYEAGRQGERELRGLWKMRHGDASAAEPCDVLWLAVGGSSVELILQLQGLLHAHGRSTGTLDYDYFGSAQGLRRAGIPHVSLANFLRRDDLARARGWRFVTDVGWEDVARSLPVIPGLTPGQQRAVADRLRLVVTRDAPLWRLRALASHRALEAFQPRAVVGFHVYGPIMVPTVIAARRLGLPCLCLQHGVIGPRYLALPCLPYDEKLVFGEYARGIMAQACPGLRLTVTGHALHDAGVTPPVASPEVLALREGVAGLVVLCTQFNEHLFYQREGWWMAAVAEACRLLGVRLALKLHPSDSAHNIGLYRTLLQPGDDRVIIVPHGRYRLDELLVACDLMITRDSTVVFEANLFDRPVVTINLGEADEELPYAGTGGARGVYRYEDIGPAIEAVLRDENVRRELAEKRADFLALHTGPGDGHATDGIVQIIEQWANGRRPAP